jgi:predicted molibdopterin-dependent oxidoreductase YjgC
MKSLVGLTQRRRTRATQGSKGKRRDIDEDLDAVAGMLERASAPVILIGSEFLQYDKGPQILEAIGKLARNIGAGVLPLPAQNNLFGSILMGVYPELLPGGVPSRDESRINDLRKTWAAHVPDFSPGWNVGKLLSGKRLKVLYLIGEVPSDTRPPADFIIFQNIYPPEASYGADLVLPSAAFSEVDGTFISGEGRIQRVRKGVDPPGEALPDWQILCRIAEKMGAKCFDFSGASGIHEEIAGLVRGFENFDNVARKAGPLICKGKMDVPRARRSEAKKATISGTKKATREFPFLLTASVAEHTHRGFPISKWVEGSKKLFAEGTIYISPIDARKAGILEGDKVVVTSAHFEKAWPARVLHEQPQGTLHVTLHHGESIGPNPHPVRIGKADV